MFLIDENHKMTTTGGKPEKYKGTEGKRGCPKRQNTPL
jgi:hypothetical protein